MNVIMIDFDKYPVEDIQTIIKAYDNVCQDPLLILPHDVGWIPEISSAQLTQIRDFINKELESKEEK